MSSSSKNQLLGCVCFLLLCFGFSEFCCSVFVAVDFVVLFLVPLPPPLVFLTRSNEIDLLVDFVELLLVEDFDVEFSFLVLKVVELSFLSEVVLSVKVVLLLVGFDDFVWFLEIRLLLVLDLMVLVWFFEERLLFGSLINLVWFLVLLDFFFSTSNSNIVLVGFVNCFVLS